MPVDLSECDCICCVPETPDGCPCEYCDEYNNPGNIPPAYIQFRICSALDGDGLGCPDDETCDTVYVNSFTLDQCCPDEPNQGACDLLGECGTSPGGFDGCTYSFRFPGEAGVACCTDGCSEALCSGEPAQGLCHGITLSCFPTECYVDYNCAGGTAGTEIVTSEFYLSDDGHCRTFGDPEARTPNVDGCFDYVLSIGPGNCGTATSATIVLAEECE